MKNPIIDVWQRFEYAFVERNSMTFYEYIGINKKGSLTQKWILPKNWKIKNCCSDSYFKVGL